jgi:hypothetical protein
MITNMSKSSIINFSISILQPSSSLKLTFLDVQYLVSMTWGCPYNTLLGSRTWLASRTQTHLYYIIFIYSSKNPTFLLLVLVVSEMKWNEIFYIYIYIYPSAWVIISNGSKIEMGRSKKKERWGWAGRVEKRSRGTIPFLSLFIH